MAETAQVGTGVPHRGDTPVTATLADEAAAAERQAHLDRIASQGFTVVENAVEGDLIDALQEALDRLARDLGTAPAGNEFEGTRTLRIYNLLAYGEPFVQVPVHPSVLPLVEGVLDRGCLISSLSSIDIGPDETPQPIHADDQLIPIPKPHPAVVCNSMWALTDFTEANGATRLVPGSHLADHNPDFFTTYDSVPAEMTRGSVLVWNGSLWHGGGANRTGERRIGLAMNYCAGYIRQQENQQLGIPRAVARTFSPRLRELVGYGVYHALIGHIDKRNPAFLLDEAPDEDSSGAQARSGDHRMIWDV